NKKGGEISIELKTGFLSIADTGCGISKSNLKHIFDRYARFNTDQGGFGIGLSLVKKICDDNDIKIICESVENQGSVFELSWSAKKI
ncbi:sensor histidine kinase, partial [Campylobacter coli]|nr:sensor histidine kinase [Campylobacter coli]